VFRDDEGRLRMVLIVRSDRGLHGGQLAVPGGKVDADDETLMATALREAEEEIGLSPADVEVIAELAPVRSGPTDFEVHAFLGRIPPTVEWRPNAEEVAEVLTPAVDELWDPVHLGALARGPARRRHPGRRPRAVGNDVALARRRRPATARG